MNPPTRTSARDAPPHKWRTLGLLALAELLGMSLWFSASAVMPALMREWRLGPAQAAWLTMAVQVGFVAGALLTAATNLADRISAPTVFAAGAALGAGLNALIPALDAGLWPTVALRFATGAALAAVYPVGMKIMTTWTTQDRGLGLGLLVGALTVGSATPHLVRGLGGIAEWRVVLYAASILALLGAAIVGGAVALGPHRSPSPPLHWRYVGAALREPSLRLANLGYLGHMWELYAMWTWIPIYLAAALRARTGDPAPGVERLASLTAFGVIAAGGLGSLVWGRLGDAWGRTRSTMLSMAVSGSCALAIGLVYGASPVWLVAVALIWGFTVVADSAQFSTAVSELAAREYIGTALAAQTALGFLLTLVSIQLTPLVAGAIGWRWTFALLAPGPAAGTLAMWRLKRSGAAARLAGGRG